MTRFAAGCLIVTSLIALVACGPGAVEQDPDVVEGCDALCKAQAACGTPDQGDVPCVDACVADVGMPGAECREALEAWAACLSASCEDECTDEQDARGEACGGTG